MFCARRAHFKCGVYHFRDLHMFILFSVQFNARASVYVWLRARDTTERFMWYTQWSVCGWKECVEINDNIVYRLAYKNIRRHRHLHANSTAMGRCARSPAYVCITMCVLLHTMAHIHNTLTIIRSPILVHSAHKFE